MAKIPAAHCLPIECFRYLGTRSETKKVVPFLLPLCGCGMHVAVWPSSVGCWREALRSFDEGRVPREQHHHRSPFIPIEVRKRKDVTPNADAPSHKHVSKPRCPSAGNMKTASTDVMIWYTASMEMLWLLPSSVLELKTEIYQLYGYYFPDKLTISSRCEQEH